MFRVLHDQVLEVAKMPLTFASQNIPARHQVRFKTVFVKKMTAEEYIDIFDIVAFEMSLSSWEKDMQKKMGVKFVCPKPILQGCDGFVLLDMTRRYEIHFPKPPEQQIRSLP